MKWPVNWQAADCDQEPITRTAAAPTGKSIDPNSFADTPPVFISGGVKQMYIENIISVFHYLLLWQTPLKMYDSPLG